MKNKLFRVENPFFSDGHLIVAIDEKEALDIMDKHFLKTLADSLRDEEFKDAKQRNSFQKMHDDKKKRMKQYIVKELTNDVSIKGIIHSFYAGV